MAVCSKCNIFIKASDYFITDDGLLCDKCCKERYPIAKNKDACSKTGKEHNWKRYVGVVHAYDICEDCRAKRRDK